MVRGIEQFKKHFSIYKDKYVLIGGTACAVVMEEVGLEFRATNYDKINDSKVVK